MSRLLALMLGMMVLLGACWLSAQRDRRAALGEMVAAILAWGAVMALMLEV